MNLEKKLAIENGIKEALNELDNQASKTKDGKKLFNTRKIIGQDYLNRAVGVKVGQFGNYHTQAMYPGFQKDNNGNFLNGKTHNYSITFQAEQIPESKYFWSFTMYDLPNRFLVDNPINRYNIGSQSKTLKQFDDGTLTIYFQKDSPSKEKERNWLPTPDGPFYIVLRIYGPGKNVTDEKYMLPEIVASKK